jgi:hypothetical protein
MKKALSLIGVLIFALSGLYLFGQGPTSGGGGTSRAVSGGSSGGASLTSYNNFATSNLFMGPVLIGSNLVEYASSSLMLFPFPGQTVSRLHIECFNGGQASLLMGDGITGASPLMHLYRSTGGQLILAYSGSGSTGISFNDNGLEFLNANAAGSLVTLGQAAVTYDIAGPLKSRGAVTFGGNVTNMVGTGLSNVVAYCNGIVTNRFTIP